MARVFISHSSRDNGLAARMKNWLDGQGFDAPPFLAFDKHTGIPPGGDWERTLYREIERCEAVVIIQTQNWLDSKWCFAEFTQARALGKPIFPVVEDGDNGSAISPDIQVLDLRKDREGGLDALSRELTQLALGAQGGFAWDAGRPPYPGLLAFHEEDAALYFGRDDEVRRLIERLNVQRTRGGARLLALLGASGSGKSSLLRAGVIPRLKRAGRNWIVVPPFRPKFRPVDELARALAVACGASTDWHEMQAMLHEGVIAHALERVAGDLRVRAAANEGQILLPIDQGEELFGAADSGQANRFFDILSKALTGESPFVAVMAIRSDYLGLLQCSEHLTARFDGFSLPPMPLNRMAQIITGPARVAGIRVEDAFVQQAVRDAETEDALPLLAFALRELYDHHGDDKHLSYAEYMALGDREAGLTPLENAVRRAADGVLAAARPSDEELAALREAFVPAMVRVNDQGDYVRRPARWDDMPAQAHALLEQLANARLLILRQDAKSRSLEVAHEALLRKWPLLRSWLDSEREFLIGIQQFDRDLEEWERAAAADRAGALLSGLKLNRARTWLADRPRQLSAKARAFVQASVHRADEEEARRLRLRRSTVRVSLAAAVGMAAVAGLAAWQWSVAARLAQVSLSRKLVADARLLYGYGGTEPARRGALLACEALRRLPEREQFQALWQYLSKMPAPSSIGSADIYLSVAISPDDRLAVAGGLDGVARVFNPDRHEDVARLVHDGPVTSVVFLPRSHRLMTGSDDGTVRLWDAEKGAELTRLAQNGAVSSVASSADEQQALVGNLDSDYEVARALVYMTNQAGGKLAEPAVPASAASAGK